MFTSSERKTKGLKAMKKTITENKGLSVSFCLLMIITVVIIPFGILPDLAVVAVCFSSIVALFYLGIEGGDGKWGGGSNYTSSGM